MQNTSSHRALFLSSITSGILATLIALGGCRDGSRDSADGFDAGAFIDIDARACSEADCLQPAEETNASCSDGIDNDDDGHVDCDDFGCSRNPAVTVCSAPPEDTIALCSDGIDNDGDGYVDCDDYDCSLSEVFDICDVPSCDPVLQSGCPDGWRCTAASAPPRCVANLTGQACESGTCDPEADTNPTGFACGSQGCQIYCDAGQMCLEGEFCRLQTSDPVWGGHCARPCDLQSDAGCFPSQSCVLTDRTLDETWQSKCVDGPGQAQAAGEACYRPPNQTYKSCDTGHLCVGDVYDEDFCRATCSSTQPCADPELQCREVMIGDSATNVTACQPVCQPESCVEANRSVCVASDGEAICECDPSYVDVQGQCLPADACDPNPCTASNRGVCEVVNYEAVCHCDDGYVDEDGSCQDATPCSPNPCSSNASGHTVCSAAGLNFSCECPADTLEIDETCVQVCPGGYHLDGDSLEPNECPSMAASLAQSSAGGVVTASYLSIGPEASDVDHYRVARENGHTYWVLQQGSSSLCTLGDETIDTAISTQWNVASQRGGGVSDLLFSCQDSNTTDYRLSVLDFDTGSDYSNNSFSATVLPTLQRWAANTLASNVGDRDHFEFAASLPINIRHTGQTMWVRVTVYDPNTGSSLTSATSVCRQSFTPTPCVDISGNGVVDVRVSVEYSPEFATDTASLNAYHLSW